MTIVRLARVTLYGLLAEKERVLDELQGLGCLHLVPLSEGAAGTDVAAGTGGMRGPSPEAREALAFLQACPARRHQLRDPTRFDARDVQRRALDIRERIRALEDERDFLEARIEALQPWGNFRLPPVESLGGNRLWFYPVPHYKMTDMPEGGPAWAEVGRDHRFVYVAAIAAEEPAGMPVARVHTGDRPLSELIDRMDEVALALQDLQAERAGMTRWLALFARSIARLEDEAAVARAAAGTRDAAPVFAVAGWAPTARLPALRAYAERERLALTAAEPGPDDAPPTLLHNPGPLAAGQDLVEFYVSPGYWTWDPSAAVFLSFAVFFAMILSDAGYALLLGLALAPFWGRTGRSETGRRLRSLAAALVGAALAWGVAAGGYFGRAPPEQSLLADLAVIDVGDFETMMTVSILVGVAHVVIGNLAAAGQHGGVRRLSSWGWIVAVLAATAWWLADTGRAPALAGDLAPWAMGVGGLLILGFSRPAGGVLHRALGGALALGRVTTAFGDVLSYLRLFALGLASASLAAAFNGLAADVAAGVSGVGLFLAALVLLIGHGLNLALAIMSGFVHGLRLNFIEFFRWSVPEEGYRFRPFAKRERRGSPVVR
jgi:V/A-type H+-transporting ATPase subunit I